MHPTKGVILVSEAFTEINAGLVIVLKSGHTSPVPMSDLMDINRDLDELAITITEAYHRHVVAYLEWVAWLASPGYLDQSGR
jgi:hypothetical protein